MSNLLLFPAPSPVVIPDAQERTNALDTTRSFIVEAPAGSGKTGLLIQRFLKLLANDSVTDPSQVLAITFTRKATHEMRDRVLQQLAAAHANAPAKGAFDTATRPLAQAALARDQRLGWGLLEHPSRLNISTIDALCIRIAGSLPILSGGVGQSPVEDAAELYAEAAARTLNLLGGEDSNPGKQDPALTAALRTLLLHRDGNLADCQKLIANMLGWRDQWGNLVPLAGDQLTDGHLENVTLARLEAALEQVICRALTRLDKLMPPSLCQELTTLAREMSYADGYKGAENPLALCRELKSAPSAATADLVHWRALARLAIAPSSGTWRKSLQSNWLGLTLEPAHKERLASLLEDLDRIPGLCDALCALTNLPPLQYPPEQWFVAKALFRVLSRALVELQLVFESRGQCDFTQFSLVARDALSSPVALDDFASSSGYNLQHLLVDEMQDTSTSQYDLIRLLTTHWDGHSQTVFLVGDPKQSIYLFRQARVERFVDTLKQQKLGDLPLTPVFMTANFRSQGNLVAAFNETFSRIFPTSPEAADAESVPFRAAFATREPTSAESIKWHTSTIPKDSGIRAEIRAHQLAQNALEIRELITQWRTRPLPPGRSEPWKIAILVRSRTHLLPIVHAIKAEPAIPFRAVNIEPLAERQEILDLLALTRALLHPADRTAWLALLRSPLCGLTLRDLHLLAGADDPAFSECTILSLISERGDLLSPDGVARLESFWTVMHPASSRRGRLPLAQWVEQTWRAFSAPAFASPEELSNINRFFELLDQLDQGPDPLTPERLKAKLEKFYAAESTAPDAVDLVTIHNAKGLEWDFVIVPELESSTGSNDSRLLSWLEVEDARQSEDIAHGILAPVKPKGAQSQALNKWMSSVERAREAAEQKRLFYVASTRAREELHLFAAPDRSAKGEIERRPGSLLAAVWPAAEHHFTDTPTAEIPVAPTEVFELAAGASLTLVPPPATRTIQRIPYMHMSGAPCLDSETWDPTSLHQRPEGSFEARALGNAIHTFLELVAERLASGTTPAVLLHELPTWTPRVQAVLRGAGLAPHDLPRATSTTLRAITRTLEDPTGAWLFAPHPQAASESTLVTPTATIRLDRTFLAGALPVQDGSTHRWIVDYKTGTHGSEALHTFLENQRSAYAPQLEAYASHLLPDGYPIVVALYFPLLGQLVHWPFKPV